MNDYEHNVYYQPEKNNLRIIAEMDFADSYEFDWFVVWRDVNSGMWFWGDDSGCSCPTPFEDDSYETLAHGLSGHDVLKAFDEWWNAHSDDYYARRKTELADQRARFIGQVMAEK